MANHDNQHYALDEQQRLLLAHRMLLDEQQRRIESRKLLEASPRTAVCPNFSILGHSGCWYCRPSPNLQTTTSTDNLLRSIARPQFQATPTSEKSCTSYLPSAASTNATIPQPNQLITPTSTASTLPLVDSSVHTVRSSRNVVASKPRAPPPAVAPTPLAALTQPSGPYQEIPLDQDFVPVTVPETFSRFLHLPVEIRKRVYVYLVDNGIYGVLLPREMRAYHQAPITRVNRQIRSESISMVYTHNAFNASSRELIKQGLMFARVIGDHKLKLIRFWKWYTAKRDLYIHFTQECLVDFEGATDETKAIAQDRAQQVFKYLQDRYQYPVGLVHEDVRVINEIVLRITPKAKAKVEAGVAAQ